MKNIKSYNEQLSKSMTKREKLFFLNKVKLQSYDYIIDFGGADGRLLYEVDKYMNKKHIDKHKKIKLINIEQNTAITTPFTYSRKYIQFTALWQIDTHKKPKMLLIFSSVLHECNEYTLSALREFINENVNTVVIRDMLLGKYNYNVLPKLYVKLLKVYQQLSSNEIKHYCAIAHNNESISSYYDIWRSYDFKREYILNMYEYFLKYTYKENWATEVKEHYFNPHAREFIKLLSSQYKRRYIKQYVLPYKKKQIYKDFGYRMAITTHIKLIIEVK